MVKVSVTEIHTFINVETKKSCKVVSTIKENGHHHVSFRGWNPFPCYCMETSFNTLKDWLAKNNWVEMNGIDRIIERRI